MTTNLEQLLPGVRVLLDTGGMWAGRVLRGQRGVVVHRYDAGIGAGADVAVCIGPCGRPTHTVDCHSAVAFQADELLLIPGDSETLYACCQHGDCPDGCTGHPVPCTSCRQPLRRTTDQQVARAMADADLRDAGHVTTAVALLVCLFGSLLFLALLAAGQRAMCATHHDQLRYCARYQETAR